MKTTICSNLYRSTRLLAILLFATMLFGCASRVVLVPSIPDVVVKTPTMYSPTLTPAAPAGNADAHFVQPTDFFFMEEPFGDTEWERVLLGKLVTAPTPETKNQAQFMSVSSGINQWAKWWSGSRIATRADLKLGTEVIFFDQSGENSVYRAPESNQEARSYDWAISRITDVSELFKGYVMVGGGYKVSEKNLRVLVK
ncbi:MAG: hypothetical protein RBS43_06210 [Candidatus Cloacimonas sp.]|nr:hypothetical protein [Candidatus Cloacimonas sp.]